jgi:opacity protein-like surface antigen
MQISRFIIVAMLSIACTRAVAGDLVAGDLGEPIDLSSFSSLDSVLAESEQAVGDDAFAFTPVAFDGEPSRIRGYVSAIAGGSFGTINAGGTSYFSSQAVRTVGAASEAMFTGGGAIGMALDRPSGLLRMEVEGRARGPLHGQTQFSVDIPDSQISLPANTTVSGGWSAMTNFWRDWFLSDRFGVYGGGGFGVGGYQYSTIIADLEEGLVGGSTVNTFAWQVGTGFTYRLSDRVTFDTGYRFFAMSPGSSPLVLRTPSYSQTFGATTSAFSASELLLSIRIYEPFRSWR